MVFAAATETPIWFLFAVPALTALLGFVVGQVVPELFNRRAAGRARYDAAIAAVSRAHAARFGVGLGIPMEWLKSHFDTVIDLLYERRKSPLKRHGADSAITTS